MAKDHYNPKFYLKRWVEEGTTHLYSAYIGENFRGINWQPKATKSVGYQYNLYQEQEEEFFKPLDNKIAKILNRLDKNDFKLENSIQLSALELENWSKYISAQFLRIPSLIEEMQESFKNNKITKDKTIREQITKIICDDRVISDLKKMQWMFCKVKASREIITSDNPLIFEPKQLDHKDCIMLLPLAPDSFALGVNNIKHKIFGMNNNEIVRFINARVIKNAQQRIFAMSKFSIENNFIYKNLNLNQTLLPFTDR